MECHKLIPIYRDDEVVAYAIVDEDDFGHLNQWRWSLSGKGYARRKDTILGIEITRYMHRIVADIPDDSGLLGDHINGNRLDNRRANLRPATIDQNAQNRFAQQGKLGGVRYKGVYASQNASTYSVRIRVDGKTLYLGSFKDQEAAARVYDAAALQHFGPRAKLNFPTDGAISAIAPQERPDDKAA